MPDNIAKNLTQEYWDKLLSENTSLKGVGWPNWPESYNLILYKKYLKGFDSLINDLYKTYDFKLDENIVVLEIGPGTGFYTTYFYKAGIINYTGADISEASVLKLSKKYTEYSFIKKDIAVNDSFITDNFENFNLVCIVDVLLHITDDNRFKNAVENISKLIKKNGFLIIGDAISIFNKKNHSEGSRYTTDVSRHIDYIKSEFKKHNVELLNVYQRYNFLLNKNFDFKYNIFNILGKPAFYVLNGFLSVFKNSNVIGKIAGYPLSVLDSIITPFQKYSKNSKFLLLKKTS